MPARKVMPARKDFIDLHPRPKVMLALKNLIEIGPHLTSIIAKITLIPRVCTCSMKRGIPKK